jgi:hypothetical protein
VDGRQQIDGLIVPALSAPKLGKILCGSELKGSSVLASCCRQRLIEQ